MFLNAQHIPYIIAQICSARGGIFVSDGQINKTQLKDYVVGGGIKMVQN